MDMLVKLFLGVVFDIMLMPGKSNYITKATLESLQDLEKFKNIDWSYVVYERLKKACDEFVKSRDMNCCMAVFLVVFMDCIERNDLNREQDGRINLYNDKLFKQLLCEQPIQQVDGMKKRKITKPKGPQKRGRKGAKPLEDFNFMRLEDTCYARFPLVCDIEVEREDQKHVDERTCDRIVLQFGNL
ncbi:uncharacterized protein LOC120670077 [Panicum virgatum]|uniref:uncharacterized protein LOC120670077 n=1 Tax=Panicum virgatum TaxID=38727 RepID=UPI0019D56690|nr:uncharacterized protein LOC120670077 [Panicum virgatum]